MQKSKKIAEMAAATRLHLFISGGDDGSEIF